MKWLIYGGKGWIGEQVVKILEDQNEIIIYGSSRADDEVNVEKEIIDKKPDRIISLVGRTCGPGYGTIDYLELKGKLVENVRDNLYAPVVLAMLSRKYKIHLTYMGTGCIFNGYRTEDNTLETMNEESGYSEKDKPDYFDSEYSTTKGFTDRIMHLFEEDVLNVRIRMPSSNDKNKRNFIIKIMNYKKICSISNSMTVLPELLPIMIDMSKKKVTGTINLTNPGVINHNEILEMVKEIIDPNLKWDNFSIEEQNKILLAGRSNNLLNTNKLEKMYPNVLSIKNSMRKVIYELKQNMNVD